MVLEQLFKLKWTEKKEHAFFLGFAYSMIAIISAKLVFPSDVGLMSIAFTSILLIPSLNALLSMEENAEIRERKFSIRQLFKDHKDIFKAYAYIFLGIFLAYSMASLTLPESSSARFFSSQLKSAGISGFAFHNSRLSSLITNNLIIFTVCFVLSLIYGAGALLFLTWNASVWGVVFGYFVRHASSLSGKNFILEFLNSLLPFLPHMTTEALSYISAAIAGGVVSKAVLREKLFSKKFHHIMSDALILLAIGFALVVIAGVIEVKAFAGF